MKENNLLLKIVCFMIIGAFLAVFNLGCKKQTPTKTLEIGAIQALTGWFAPNEVGGSREMDCMVDIINEGGGIKVGDESYLVKLTTVDNQSSLDGTAAAANQLAYQNKVKYVVETLGFLSISGNSIFTENKIIAVCPYNTLIPDEIGQSTPYKFIGHASMYGQILGAFQGMKTNFPDVKNIVCVNQDDGTIPTTTAVVKKVAPGMGLNVVGGFVSFSTDTVDYNPIASKINAVKGVDAVVVTGASYSQTAAIAKALRSMGNQKPFIFVGTLPADKLVDMIGKEFATNIMTLGMIKDSNNPPIINELMKRMQTKYKDIFVAGNTANCLYMLKQVIEAAQSLDTDAVKAKWESMASFDSIYGESALGGLKTYGIKHAVAHPIPTLLIMNGKGKQGPWVKITIP